MLNFFYFYEISELFEAKQLHRVFKFKCLETFLENKKMNILQKCESAFFGAESGNFWSLVLFYKMVQYIQGVS